MRRLALCALLVACGSKSDGPKPVLSNVAPSPVCDAQNAITITLTGTGFSPEVQNGLTSSPFVVLPSVNLISASGTVTPVPEAGISFPDTTGDSLTVVVPAMLVPPGTYGVEVIDPNTNSSTLAASLVIDPPPTLTAVAPNTGDVGATVTVTLTGTGFKPGMTVTLDATPPVAGTNVTVSPDGTSAMVTFNLTGVAPGTYSITVSIDGGTCTATLMNAFTVGAEFTITGIDPPFGCMCSDTNVTISSAGAFVSTPSVQMVLHGTTTPITQLKRVAFVNANTITAVVPAGLPLGTYDVTVINPPSVGTFGTLVNGFRVVSMPPPTVSDVVPGRAPAATSTNLDIYGTNFRATATVTFIDTAGNTAATAGTVNVVTAGHITATITTPANGTYLVRVTDTDEMTFGDWSAFIVGPEGSSGKLNAFVAQGNLVTGRRMLAGVGAQDDLGNFYVYAIGGDTGGGTPTVLASVEVAQQGKFGGLSAWQQEKASNNLLAARDAPIAVAVPIPQATDPCFFATGTPGVTCIAPQKTYIYVLGGSSGGATPTIFRSAERAVVLANADAPVVTKAQASATAGSLGAGTYYYKVSAIVNANDPDNPSGETLPSDEAIVTLASNQSAIDLQWNAVTTNSLPAQMYKIYRTPMVNGVSQGEQLIATQPGTSFTDTGAAAGAEVPLPPGSLGVWVSQGANVLQTARWGAQGATVVDTITGVAGTTTRSLYVLGGMSDNATGVLATIERAPIVAATGALGAFTSVNDTNLVEPLAFFSLAVETAANVGGFAGVARFITAGGITNPAPTAMNFATADISSGNVTSGGGNGTFTIAGGNNKRAGDMAVIASNKLFWLGGASSAATNPFAVANPAGTGDDLAFDGTGAFTGSIQSTANSFGGSAKTALGVVVTIDNFIYFYGGTSDGTNAVQLAWQTF
jgi:hypothetical protein